MIIDPALSKIEIQTKINTINTKLDALAETGDTIMSAGAKVEYNNRYNHFRKQLETLYSMKTTLISRGEW